MMSVPVASGIKLKAGPGLSLTNPVTWASSDTAVADVLQDGWVIGLNPGSTRVTVSDGGRTQAWAVAVVAAEDKPRSAESIRQYPDNRRFELGGRLCFGSELNGHVLGAPNKETLVSNRIINPQPLSAGQNLLWQVAAGAEMFDGAGVLMGTVAPAARLGDKRVPATAFNYGMSKVIHGRLCLYGFGTELLVDPGIRKEVEGEGVVATSAWVPLDSVLEKESLLDRLGLGRGKLPALPLGTERYRITGGDPKAYVLPEGELAIVQAANGPVPSHYLRRPSGTINVLYSVPGFGLGGQGLDSFLIRDGLTFRPAKAVRPFVQPTYYPRGHPKARQVSPRTMTFLYGGVEAPGCQRVFGWVAKEAMELVP